MSVITTPVENPVTLAACFFERSVGNWTSQRRYYTLKSGDTQEVTSHLSIEFLESGHPTLATLEAAHGLEQSLVCGIQFAWESNYTRPSGKQSTGSTAFGIRDNVLYRDRGFATPKPVVATYQMRDRNTMQLHTEYSGSIFNEELKLVGSNYRTRQTIMSRAGQEIMIGQYLEARV